MTNKGRFRAAFVRLASRFLLVFQPSFPPGAQFGIFKINDQTANFGIIQYNLLTLTPVPLPAAGWLTLSMLSAVGVMARKRRI